MEKIAVKKSHSRYWYLLTIYLTISYNSYSQESNCDKIKFSPNICSMFSEENHVDNLLEFSLREGKNRLLIDRFGESFKIAKINDSSFYFNGSIRVNYRDSLINIPVTKYDLRIASTHYTFELDSTFNGFVKLSPIEIEQVIRAYNEFLKDSILFSPLDQLDSLSFIKVEKKMSVIEDGLFLAILNGCKDCIPLFEKIPDQFPYAYRRFEYGILSRILEDYGFIKPFYSKTKKRKKIIVYYN